MGYRCLVQIYFLIPGRPENNSELLREFIGIVSDSTNRWRIYMVKSLDRRITVRISEVFEFGLLNCMISPS